MSQDPTILRQIYDSANRANPYPLWAKLRQTPVCWQEDGPDEAGDVRREHLSRDYGVAT